ncbi:MAG: hypothetical protein LBJ74_05710 [Heliobacteriaceae bacterium]|jgi:hypothetical protein|nr:hypothetical protein [Heliobacteriaceae bacterium]
MDISGNQAKLLSLTMKLNINYDELRAQIIKNAAQTGEVPENEVYFKLTPEQLLEYAEGKEQYTIVDLSNRVYVAPEDAQNYVSATDLMKFLSSYGIVDYDQLQKSYDTLFANAQGQEGIALKLTRLQEQKPTPTGEYWSETNNTTQEKVYANMLERVTATLNNVSNTMCSCVFYAISEMLSYTDATSVTDKEIYEKFNEVIGVDTKPPAAPEPVTVTATQPPPVEQTTPAPVDAPQNQQVEEAVPAPVEAPQNQQVEEKRPSPADVTVTQDKQTVRTDFTSSTGQSLSIPIRHIVIEETFEDGTVEKTDSKTKAHNFSLSDAAMQADKSQIRSRLDSLRTAMYAAKRLERLNPDTPLEVGMVDLSRLSTTAQRLFSNYKIDENGNYVLSSDGERELKTLRQKIIDTYSIATNYSALGVEPGEINDNPGDIKNKETDTTVRGALKSAHKDIQKALGAEGFDTDRYLADYAAWADEYASLSQAYDVEFANLQKLQEPEDAEKAQWYTNLWNAMGGKTIRLGEDVQMNVSKSPADHGHAHGSYSNELKREFVIPEKSDYKPANQYIVMDESRMNDEVWLRKSLENGDIRLEKYINKTPASLNELEQTYSAPAKPQQHRPDHSSLAEYENLKKLNQSDKSFESFY